MEVADLGTSIHGLTGHSALVDGVLRGFADYREGLRLTWALAPGRMISIVHEENTASIALRTKLGGALGGTHAGPGAAVRVRPPGCRT